MKSKSRWKKWSKRESASPTPSSSEFACLGSGPARLPLNLIQSRFESEIRNEVLEVLLPQAFRDKVQKQGLKVVGTPDISDLKFEAGQPIRFKAEFEVAPEFELGEYRGLPAKYEEPSVSDEEVDKRLESMRESKAEFVNLDPRPIESGDYVLVHLKSLSGLAEPIDQDVQIQVGAEETLPAFNEALTRRVARRTEGGGSHLSGGVRAGKLAGKTVRFVLTPKIVRKKELPALDDEFAKDLGDYPDSG